VTEGSKVLPRDLAQQRRRSERGDFLVGIDHHIPAKAGDGAGLLQRVERFEHDEQPALHVRRAGSVQRIRIGQSRGLEGVLGREDRVHMTRQDQPAIGAFALAGKQVRAMRHGNLLALVAERRHRIGIARRYGVRDRRQTVCDQAMHRRQPGKVPAAAVDLCPVDDVGRHGALAARQMVDDPAFRRGESCHPRVLAEVLGAG
jgi:hypothetical protein